MIEDQNQAIIIIDLIPHKTYCALIQKGTQYVSGKIKNNTWTEGVQYFRDPDGQIWVSLKGVAEWVTQTLARSAARQTQQVSDLSAQESRSVLRGKKPATNQSGTDRPRRKTSKQPPIYALI